MSETRTRFAPSPTGYMHIGNLRTALFTYLIARKNKGEFLLRIEDTDQGRFVEGAIDAVYNCLKLVGISHDEGPDIGGPVGPYIQSERREIYKEYAEKLVELGGAYYCFCTKERIDKLREEAGDGFKYDKKCKALTKEEIQSNIDAGMPYVIRQAIPETGSTSFDDYIYGTITVDNAELDDGVLLKADGLPTYNFANVIDDHLMKINPVVRGSEYLASAPKYNLLYNSFGWDIPNYVHVSTVLKENGKKLSKRDGDASFEDFYEKGYLIEAIVNYIALVGWSPGGEEEFFTLKELEEVFDPKNISKSPGVFDVSKLRWMNGEYINRLELAEFDKMAKEWYKKASLQLENTLRLSELLQPRVEVLNEIIDMVDFLIEIPDYDPQLYFHKRMKIKLPDALDLLGKIKAEVEGIADFTEENINAAMDNLAVALEVKSGKILSTFRVAMTGKKVSPGGGVEIASIVGKEETLNRINYGLEKLTKAVTED